jgi:hypothetical protein
LVHSIAKIVAISQREHDLKTIHRPQPASQPAPKMRAIAALSLVLVNLLASGYPTPTSAQFQCSSEGFFVDPNDCSKFVRCVDTYQTGRFQVYTFDCPDGEL